MANYAWTDSSARLPGRSTDNTLPGQSAHLGNLSIGYEKFGFAGKASWNFHGKYIDAVGATAADDVYYGQPYAVRREPQPAAHEESARVRGLLQPDERAAALLPGRDVASRTEQEYYRWWATSD